jgi:hypothetical protein
LIKVTSFLILIKMIKELKDFERYSRALMASGDDDPTYPFIRAICDIEGFIPEWFCFVYVSFYNIESAIRVCREYRCPADWDKDFFQEMRESEQWKFGHERRGSQRRSDVMAKHLQEAKELVDYIQINLSGLMSDDMTFFQSNRLFRDKLESMSNIGGWAAFKIAELFEKTCGYKHLSIPDLGLDGRNPNSNDGPIGGLRWIFGRDGVFDKGWFSTWNEFGQLLADAWGVGMGEVETKRFQRILGLDNMSKFGIIIV